MSKNKEYRRDLQMLRGLAVLAVLLFHSSENLTPFGYLGVDVFFVLSGFVITPLILQIFSRNGLRGKEQNSLKQFYLSRIYRLAPAMLVSMLFSLILVFFLVSPDSFQIFAYQMRDSILFAGNYGAFKNIGNYFSNSGNPLLHTWSLAVEAQVYLVLPIILFFFHKNILRLRIALVLLTLLSLTLFVFPKVLAPIYSIAKISDPFDLSFYSPLHRIWQFLIGSLFYLILNDQSLLSRRTFPRFSRILCLFLVGFMFFPHSFGDAFGSILVSFITALIISLKSLNYLPTILKASLEWLGDRSYSIYLYHLPILFVAKNSPYLVNSPFEWALILLAIVTSFVLGAISYSEIENRYRMGRAAPPNTSSLRNQVLALFILCALSSTIMIKGADSDYWGLRKIPLQPMVAWNLDANCMRMSEFDAVGCDYKTIESYKTVLLIGDSHASQFSQALVDAAKESNWNSVIWTMANCNLMFHDDNGNISNDCLVRNEQIFKWISKKRPNLVIVSQHNRKSLAQDSLKSAIISIKSLVPSVMVIGNTPIFADERFMTSPAIFQDAYEIPRLVPLTEMDRSDNETSDVFLKTLKAKGIEVADLDYLWCDRKFCNRFGDKGWLYFDKSHLSKFGAEKAVPFFVKLLRSHTDV